MKRALLVGIDTYDAFDALSGCVNDVVATAPLLARNDDGLPNFDCQILANARQGVGRDRLRQAVTKLLAPGADVALLYAAGHGIERNGEVVLATTDGTPQTPGIGMPEILAAAAHSTVREVILILDCCFSGAVAQVPQMASDAAVLRPGIAILTASRNDQPAAETVERRGLFSTMLCDGLAGGAADVLGKVTIGGLYAYLSECFGPWDQRPMLKANIEREHELRRCPSAVPLANIRRLPLLFPTPDHEFLLDPSYEPDALPPHPENERIFAILQQCRSAKLLVPIGTEHLYFAAMESRSCQLTPLGRHYRHMAEKGWL